MVMVVVMAIVMVMAMSRQGMFCHLESGRMRVPGICDMGICVYTCINRYMQLICTYAGTTTIHFARVTS